MDHGVWATRNLGGTTVIVGRLSQRTVPLRDFKDKHKLHLVNLFTSVTIVRSPRNKK